MPEQIRNYKDLRVYQNSLFESTYDQIIGQIVKMIEEAHKWIIRAK